MKPIAMSHNEKSTLPKVMCTLMLGTNSQALRVSGNTM